MRVRHAAQQPWPAVLELVRPVTPQHLEAMLATDTPVALRPREPELHATWMQVLAGCARPLVCTTYLGYTCHSEIVSRLSCSEALLVRPLPMLTHGSFYLGIDVSPLSHADGFIASVLLNRHGQFERYFEG